MKTMSLKKHFYSKYLKLVFVSIVTVLIIFSCSSDSDDPAPGDSTPTDTDVEMPGTRVEVITDSTAPLVAMATDDNDVSYWFYAVRDAQGIPEYINELVLTEENGSAAEKVISISFDDLQRASKVTLPDLQGEMVLNYISSDEVEVTVTVSDGSSETVIVPNPYVERSASRHASGVLQDAMCRDWAGWPADIIETWAGVIEACQAGPTPIVRIFKYNNLDQLTGAYLAQVRPKDDVPGFYHFSYQIAWVDDNEMWESHCRCMKNISAALLAGDTISPLFNVANSVSEGLQSIVSYLMDEESADSVKLTALKINATNLGDVVTPNGLTGTILEVADYIGSSGDPCSNDVFEELRQRVFEPIELEVVYSGKVKDFAFNPDRDNAIPQISFAEMCCNNVTEAGGDEPETHEHELGLTRGEFVFEYETYSIKDQIIVVYEGNWLFNSGCVGTKGYKSTTIQYEGNSHKVRVQVFPNCDGGTSGTAWEYKISCPEPTAQ